jgi:hypothetical protein
MVPFRFVDVDNSQKEWEFKNGFYGGVHITVTKPGQAREFAQTFVFALQFRFYTSYDNKWVGKPYHNSWLASLPPGWMEGDSEGELQTTQKSDSSFYFNSCRI